MKHYALPTPPKELPYVISWSSDLTRVLGRIHTRLLSDVLLGAEVVTLHLQSPANGTYPVVRVPADCSVRRVDVVLNGSSPSCNLDVRYGPDVSSTTSIFTAAKSCTSTTTGDSFTPDLQHGIDADAWIVCSVTNVTNVDYACVTITLEPR